MRLTRVGFSASLPGLKGEGVLEPNLIEFNKRQSSIENL